MQRVSFDRVDFFLGATTPAGFKGYFEPLRREPGMQMVLIKSGPGCGKSTLMKQLARRAIQQGEPVECIHCASDPDSFDGVIFVRQRRAIVDATAPHTIEPDAPGADEVVLSLYHTIQADALRPHAEEVKALFARNAALRARAARYVASAGSLLLDSRRAEACSANFAKSAPLRQAIVYPAATPHREHCPRRAAAALCGDAQRARCSTSTPRRRWLTGSSCSGTNTVPCRACCWS